jgi:predicted transcriptional regulator
MSRIIQMELPDEVVKRLDALAAEGMDISSVVIRAVELLTAERPSTRSELLSPALRELAERRRVELAGWEAKRCLTSESKAEAFQLAGIVTNSDMPSDVSERFRDYLYEPES